MKMKYWLSIVIKLVLVISLDPLLTYTIQKLKVKSWMFLKEESYCSPKLHLFYQNTLKSSKKIVMAKHLLETT